MTTPGWGDQLPSTDLPRPFLRLAIRAPTPRPRPASPAALRPFVSFRSFLSVPFFSFGHFLCLARLVNAAITVPGVNSILVDDLFFSFYIFLSLSIYLALSLAVSVSCRVSLSPSPCPNSTPPAARQNPGAPPPAASLLSCCWPSSHSRRPPWLPRPAARPRSSSSSHYRPPALCLCSRRNLQRRLTMFSYVPNAPDPSPCRHYS